MSLLAVSCSGRSFPASGPYLGVVEDGLTVLYLRAASDDRGVAGSLTLATSDDEGRQARSVQMSFTATVEGDTVVFEFDSGDYSIDALNGTLVDDGIVIELTEATGDLKLVTLVPATVSAYNVTLDGLRLMLHFETIDAAYEQLAADWEQLSATLQGEDDWLAFARENVTPRDAKSGYFTFAFIDAGNSINCDTRDVRDAVRDQRATLAEIEDVLAEIDQRRASWTNDSATLPEEIADPLISASEVDTRYDDAARNRKRWLKRLDGALSRARSIQDEYYFDLAGGWDPTTLCLDNEI